MKKLLAMMVCLAGLMVCVTSARADVYSFNAGPANSPGAMPGNFGYASGLWNVTLTAINSNTWRVDVIGDSANMPNGNIDQISLGFITPSMTSVPLTTQAGATTPTVMGGTGGPWNATGSSFTSPLNASDIMGNRTNQFSGTFSVANNNARLFSISLQNSVSQQWKGSTAIQANSLAPEMPGAALLLPALLPVGMVLRGKKRGFRNVFRSSATV